VHPLANYIWRNATGIVKAVKGPSQVLVAMVGALSVTSIYDVGALVVKEDAEKPPMGETLQLRKLTGLQKQSLASYEKLQATSEDRLLEAPELTACFHHIRLRGLHAGDLWAPGQLLWVDPHTVAPALATNLAEAAGTPAEMVYAELRENLKTTTTTDKAVLLLFPIHSHDPEHWTLLAFHRKAGQKLVCKHFDSLAKPAQNGRAQARAMFEILLNIVGQELVENAELPETDTTVQQTGITCGFHTANRAEELYREFRGEGRRRVYTAPRDVSQEVNKFIRVVREAREKQDAAAAAAAAAAAPPLPPPPLPPPASPPPGALPQELGQALAALPPGGSAGCSKCRRLAKCEAAPVPSWGKAPARVEFDDSFEHEVRQARFDDSFEHDGLQVAGVGWGEGLAARWQGAGRGAQEGYFLDGKLHHQPGGAQAVAYSATQRKRRNTPRGRLASEARLSESTRKPAAQCSHV